MFDTEGVGLAEAIQPLQPEFLGGLPADLADPAPGLTRESLSRGSLSRGSRAVEALGAELIERIRPVTFAREQTLPVAAQLADLLPGGSLRRGTTLSVQGDAATSLALSLVAEASGSGSWTAAVGLPSLGLAAAAELGVVLERLVLVPEFEPGQWASIVAALVGSVDCLLVAPPSRLTPTAARRLQARLRERGSVVVVVGTSTDLVADVALMSRTQTWEGLGQGHGHLRARQVTVEVEGRRAAARRRRDTFWLGQDVTSDVFSQPERYVEVS